MFLTLRNSKKDNDLAAVRGIAQQNVSEVNQKALVADRTIRVKEGGSTTIPCTFTFPEHVERSALEILWHDTEYGDCSNPTSIYNSSMNTAHDKYQGRISKMKNPIRNRTESIKIQRLNRTDGPVICCQVNIQNAEHTFSYFPSYGTHLLFSDQVWVDQLEAVPASLGEDVTIPCHINYTAGFIKKNLQQVIWTRGEKCLIANTTFTFQAKHGWSTLGYSNFSVVDFPNDVSLRIRNVQKEDTMIFCCSVKINETTFSAKHGTELVIKESRSNFELAVNQPQESSAPVGGSANITCSYNTPINKTPMDDVIYWRAGRPDGPIAYHASRWMVHPTYRGRTNVTRKADLQIMGVKETDSSVYYCFVTLILCSGNRNITTVISNGNGTKLKVTDNQNDSTPTNLGGLGDPIFLISITIKVILIIGIVIGGILIIRKVLPTR
ncbi:sialic acid-binding Ig-like lectin 14 [Pelobates cultripes]|uniref:Sialic acid-binding Ig-like lectin 14 n=1 Tax=Pelobates cultripes TaxID=61616 RepID=A0AAD1RJ69_PELCU|nr:sialic acid-binding Ig-like lectin 14 [Pelobates cultripes]